MEQKAMSIFKPTALVGAIALITGFSVTTHAADQQATNDEQNATSLDTIVVTASRTPEKVKNVPARIDVIDQKTIEQNPTLNVSDLLQKDASVYIKQYGGIGQVSAISLRGTNAFHTLVLKDGARLNSQNDLAPLYSGFLDTTDIERIEILKGPASVQYGTDAVGGVIQLISKVPEKTGASITGIYGENNTYKTIANANIVSNSGWYAQIGGQRLESDGTRILNTQEKSEKAGFDQKGYNAKIGYSEKNKIDASVEISENKGTDVFTYDYITSNAQRQFDNQIINAKVSYNLLSNLILNTRYSNVKDNEYVIQYGSHYDTENNEGDVNLQWKYLDNQNILFGATLLNAQYTSNTIQNGNQTINSTGYYAQHQFNTDKLNTGSRS